MANILVCCCEIGLVIWASLVELTILTLIFHAGAAIVLKAGCQLKPLEVKKHVRNNAIGFKVPKKVKTQAPLFDQTVD